MLRLDLEHNDKYSPYPEEMNRQMTDSFSDLYFAPTQESKANLLSENHKKEAIYVTGNNSDRCPKTNS